MPTLPVFTGLGVGWGLSSRLAGDGAGGGGVSATDRYVAAAFDSFPAKVFFSFAGDLEVDNKNQIK